MCHGEFFYKRSGEKGRGISLGKVPLCYQNFSELVYLLRVGFKTCEKSGSSSWQGKVLVLFFSGFFVWPLCISGG
jgi:hypothetical protein